MYSNSASLNNSIFYVKDKTKPLIITGCGTYQLFTRTKLPTFRPKGRLDFQLLYIASGKAHFQFGDTEKIVSAGHFVLYRPKELQKYEYYGKDHPTVYWIHFTGNNVTNLLRSYGLTEGKKVFYCGSDIEYQTLFRCMIYELQMRQEHYEELLELYFKQLLIKLQRYLTAAKKLNHSPAVKEIDQAAIYFNEHYHEFIRIEQYAKEHSMSMSWFIQNFKLYTGFTPMQYILSKRICNAETLLQNTQYNITEISHIVGYENPLYFSRIFKKMKGLSPSEYRKLIE